VCPKCPLFGRLWVEVWVDLLHVAVGHVRVGVARDRFEDLIARTTIAQPGETGVAQVVELQVAGEYWRAIGALLVGIAQPDLRPHTRCLEVAIEVALTHRRAALGGEEQGHALPSPRRAQQRTAVTLSLAFCGRRSERWLSWAFAQDSRRSTSLLFRPHASVKD
jgi:hypothetical protein